ncbi:MAG: hypothetical protein Q9213_000795 [Squamulea squamosa]
MKEQLRFVSDTLASNDSIRSLSITIPCDCCLKGGNGANSTVDEVLDFLTPLKQLRVASKSVKLEAAFDDGYDGLKGDVCLNICPEPECQQLARQLQGALGPLDGKQLDHEEEAWKKLKAMGSQLSYAKSSDTVIYFRTFWDQLDHMQNHRKRWGYVDPQITTLLDSFARVVEKRLELDQEIYLYQHSVARRNAARK